MYRCRTLVAQLEERTIQGKSANFTWAFEFYLTRGVRRHTFVVLVSWSLLDSTPSWLSDLQYISLQSMASRRSLICNMSSPAQKSRIFSNTAKAPSTWKVGHVEWKICQVLTGTVLHTGLVAWKWERGSWRFSRSSFLLRFSDLSGLIGGEGETWCRLGKTGEQAGGMTTIDGSLRQITALVIPYSLNPLEYAVLHVDLLLKKLFWIWKRFLSCSLTHKQTNNNASLYM